MKMALPLNFVGKTGPLSSELSETSVLTQKQLDWPWKGGEAAANFIQILCLL